MKVLKPLLISTALIAVMLCLSVWAMAHAPPQIAIHYGLDGQPDRFGSRSFGLMLIPTVAALLVVAFACLPHLMPARARLEGSDKAYAVIWIVLVAYLLVGHAALIARAAGVDFDMRRIIALAAGLVFVISGNYFGKLRRNYLIGIRTPWTLEDDRVWDRTQRFGGRLLVLFGLCVLPAAFVVPPKPLFLVIIVGSLSSMLIATAYSYVLARRLGV